MTGVRIRPEEWQLGNLDPHHLINFKILNHNGKVIREGRNLADLRNQAKDIPITKVAPKTTEKVKVYQQWPSDLGAIPEERMIKRAGIQLRVYPALKIVEGGVTLEDFDTQDLAQQHMSAAVLWLLRQVYSDQEAFLKKDLKQLKKLELLFAPVGRAGELQEDLAVGSFQWAFIDPWLDNEKALPRSREAFEQLMKSGLANFNDQGQRLSQLVYDILEHRQKIAAGIKGKVSFALAFVYSDVQAQLNRMIYSGFIQATPRHWLEQFPRYLKGIDARLDRSKGVPGNEQMVIEELNQWWQRIEEKQKQMDSESRQDHRLVELRWMLEEYRISLFAQKLGTLKPVSGKRLQKLWDEIS